MEWFKTIYEFDPVVQVQQKPKKTIVRGEDKKKNDSVIRTPDDQWSIEFSICV